MRKISVVPNGPYLVYGDVPLVRKRRVLSEGGLALTWQKTERIETEDTYALCRCGRSGSKPFCDGTHARIAWDGAETAGTGPTAARAREVPGSMAADAGGEAAAAGIVVKRDMELCMGAAFCVARAGKIPDLMAGAADSDVRAQIIGMIDRCPSGSYTYSMQPAGPEIEPDYPVAIAVTSDAGPCGGSLWVTGGIPVERADGQPFETRNRVTLCRCGGSENKPLCDGTHREIGFRDEGG